MDESFSADNSLAFATISSQVVLMLPLHLKWSGKSKDFVAVRCDHFYVWVRLDGQPWPIPSRVGVLPH